MIGRLFPYDQPIRRAGQAPSCNAPTPSYSIRGMLRRRMFVRPANHESGMRRPDAIPDAIPDPIPVPIATFHARPDIEDIAGVLKGSAAAAFAAQRNAHSTRSGLIGDFPSTSEIGEISERDAVTVHG